MAKLKIERLQSLIRRDVAEIINTQLLDPRVRMGTVTSVKLTPDLRFAKIYVSCLGGEADQRTFMRGLESARGLIQSRVAKHLRTRVTPHLVFEYDTGIEKSIRVSAKIERARSQDRAAQLARGETPEEVAIEGEGGGEGGAAGVRDPADEDE